VFWTAYRVLRHQVLDALKAVGVEALPPPDFFDALLETGKAIVGECAIKVRNSPVKHDSLSRSGVGVEFYQTTKGDKKNQREFLFSIGVDEKNVAFPIDRGNHPAVVSLFSQPDFPQVLDALYQNNLEYMPSRDVTDSLSALIGQNRGIRLKDNGVVYFVPDCAVSIVDRVFSMLNQAGCRCTMLMQDMKDELFCRQVLENTSEQLLDNLEQMQDEMRDLLDNNKQVRINGLQSKMADLSRYADVLEYYQKMFGTNLDVASKSLQATFILHVGVDWLDVTPFVGPALMRVGGRSHAAAPC
jgi:hypothetical protein